MNSKDIKNLVILFILGGLLVGMMFFAPLTEMNAWGWDLSIFRAGSKALLHGENPYIPENIPRFADGAELATIPYYTYAPFFTMLISPLALLPPNIAIRLWFMVNLVLYIGSVAMILSALRWQLPTKTWFGLMLLLGAFAPLRTLLIIGQSGVIMLFFLSLSFRLLKRGKSWQAGAVMSMAFFKPHLILLLPFFAFRRQWKLITGFVIAIVLTAFPFWGLLDDWIRTMLATRGENIQYGCVPFSSLTMLLKCVVPEGEGSLWIIGGIVALVSIITIWLVFARVDISSNQYDLQISLIIILGLMVIDNIRVADLVLLILPLLVVLHNLKLLNNNWLRRLVIGLVMIAYIFPYAADAMSAVTHIYIGGMAIWYTFVVLAMWGALVVLSKSRNITSPRHP